MTQNKGEALNHTDISTRDVLLSLYRELGISEEVMEGKVSITGQDPVCPSTHRIGDATAAALAAYGTEAATLWRERGGEAQDLSVSVENAIHQLMAIFATRVNGVKLEDLTEDRNLLGNTDFYRCADDRHIFLVMSFPRLRDIVCEVLNCPPLKDSYVSAIASWDAFALEAAINAKGGTATAVRTQKEWRAHPQGLALMGAPIISIEKIGDSAPAPFRPIDPAASVGPLSGVRVLDNTHVIAGPISTRYAAELGADVLHISAPEYPDPNAMIMETNIGKRSAFCDFNDPDHVAKFWEVLDETDLYVSSYMGLESKGFGPLDLIKRRPGLVVLDFRGWGLTGPWAERGAFDQLACSATGFAEEEGSFDNPSLPPTYLLNDYLAGLLGAAGAVEALRRRARDGGSYHVHIDLARVCMWVQDLGLIPRNLFENKPRPNPAEAADKSLISEGPWGVTSYLPTFVSYSSMRSKLTLPSTPLGAAPFEWW